ncbi:hypothetical protein J6590_020259 [Homalodisca vitripennis]|nr:hypothetical protein J6590_020259 [Homalodisca vitripennis]
MNGQSLAAGGPLIHSNVPVYCARQNTPFIKRDSSIVCGTLLPGNVTARLVRAISRQTNQPRCLQSAAGKRRPMPRATVTAGGSNTMWLTGGSPPLLQCYRCPVSAVRLRPSD